MMKDLTGAIEEFSAVISQDPTIAYLYYNRGVAYSQLQQWEEAHKDLTTYITMVVCVCKHVYECMYLCIHVCMYVYLFTCNRYVALMLMLSAIIVVFSLV